MTPCERQYTFICDHISDLKQPFFFMMGGNDVSIPSEIDNQNFRQLLDSDIISGIFAQNLDIYKYYKYKSKYFSIPIGIDYHTLARSKTTHEWGGYPNMNPLVQEIVFNRCINSSKSLELCDPKFIYTNFHCSMDLPPQRRIMNRRPLYNMICNKPWIKFLPICKRSEFWQQISDKVFVLCPQGNGMDTHRTWEVLMMGKIPIIQNLPVNSVYSELPVWIVDDWKEFSDSITTELLIYKHKEFCKNWNRYNFSKLTLDYWKQYVHSIVYK